MRIQEGKKVIKDMHVHIRYLQISFIICMFVETENNHPKYMLKSCIIELGLVRTQQCDTKLNVNTLDTLS